MTPPWWAALVVAAITALGFVWAAYAAKQKAKQPSPVEDMKQVADERRSLYEDVKRQMQDEREERHAAEAAYRAEIDALRSRVSSLEAEVTRLGGDPRKLNGVA